ncbi:MAG: zinc ribbon domain-containing protein, partial [Treponema sp.]|nr:zinc ribbon domain-containing protein [Treponema sp.]
MALCKNCGAKLHRGAKFCSECGAAVGSQDTAITLPKGVYKKELEILPHTTISGSGFSCETDTLADLQSIVVVPEGKSIVINDEATIEGVIFVGKAFYDEHKDSLLSELNADAQVAFVEQLATADRDWDALCEFSEQNESDALLRILSDNVKLKKVCVIGSPASGIYVGGKAEFSCVSVLQSTASNLVVDSAAEICFTPLTEDGESTNNFACSLKGHGIVCKGNMNLSGDEQKKNIRICANYNMLQGIRLSGGMNAQVEKTGIVECAGNL